MLQGKTLQEKNVELKFVESFPHVYDLVIKCNQVVFITL